MGRGSREKGRRGEREIIDLLQPAVDDVCDAVGQPRFQLRRNQDQRFAAKQYDVIGLPWLAIEVKRQENLSGIGSWWRQLKAATRDKQVPVLFYRQSHRPWRVRMNVLTAVVIGGPYVRMTVDISIDSFLVWFRQKLLAELG